MGVVTWTGDRLVVWGGRTPNGDSKPTVALLDGAMFDPSSGRWTRMSSPPFSEPLVDPHGARLGRDVLVVGSLCDVDIPPPTEGSPHCPGGPVAAVYSPETNRWTKLATPPSAPKRVALAGDRAAGYITDWVGDDSLGYRYWRDGDRWEVLDFPEPTPSNLSSVQPSMSTSADGSHTDVLSFDREPVPDATPTKLRRWALDTDDPQGWVGPQPLAPQPAMTTTTFLTQVLTRSQTSSVVAVAGSPFGEELYGLDRAGVLTPIVLPALAGQAPFNLPYLLGPFPWLASEGFGSTATVPGASPGESPRSWLLGENDSWVPESNPPPYERLWGTSSWAGDRLYTARTVWLPPAEALADR